VKQVSHLFSVAWQGDILADFAYSVRQPSVRCGWNGFGKRRGSANGGRSVSVERGTHFPSRTSDTAFPFYKLAVVVQHFGVGDQFATTTINGLSELNHADTSNHVE